jgi:hypothetical protein
MLPARHEPASGGARRGARSVSRPPSSHYVPTVIEQTRRARLRPVLPGGHRESAGVVVPPVGGKGRLRSRRRWSVPGLRSLPALPATVTVPAWWGELPVDPPGVLGVGELPVQRGPRLGPVGGRRRSLVCLRSWVGAGRGVGGNVERRCRSPVGLELREDVRNCSTTGSACHSCGPTWESHPGPGRGATAERRTEPRSQPPPARPR